MRRGFALLAFLLASAPLFAGGEADWLRTARPHTPATLFPPTSPLFTPLKADPLEMRSGARIIDSSRSGTAQLITAVGVRPVIYERPLNGGMRAQFTFGAVGYGRFDLEEDLDLETEDWRFGFLLMTRYGPWSYMASLLHLSSHLGDELIGRTGRARLEYVIEEIGFTTSYDAGDHLRAYWGAHYAFRQSLGDEPGRVQAGVEYWLLPRLVPGGIGPYVALDVQARQERDWSPGANAVIGWAFPGWVRDRTLDLQVVGAVGPATTRQFLLDDETYAGIAFAADL